MFSSYKGFCLNNEKVESVAVVSDPFSASKRSKKSETVLIEENESECEIIQVNEKVLEQEYEAPVKKLMKLTYPTETETKLKYNKEDFTCDKTDWNLKLVSWNINGIRAWIEVSFIVN